MVLQASGTISLGDIGSEFLDMNPITLSEFYDSDLGVPKITDPPAPGRQLPQISLSDFYGTRRVFTYSWNPSGSSVPYAGKDRTAVACDEFDMLRAANSAGWNGYSSLIFEISDLIMAYATSRVRPAMSMDYTSQNYTPTGYGKRWPRDIIIDNRGWIMGKGGNGSSGNGKGQDGGGALSIRGATGSTGNYDDDIEENEANNGNAGGTGLVTIKNTGAILGGGGGGNGGNSGVAGGGGGGAGGGSGGSKGGAGGGSGGSAFKSGNNGGAVAVTSYRGGGGQAGGGGGGWDSRGKNADAYGGGGGGGRFPGTSASGGTAGSAGGSIGGSYSAKGGNAGDSGGGGGYGKGGGTSSSQGSPSAGGYAIRVQGGEVEYQAIGNAFQIEGINEAQ